MIYEQSNSRILFVRVDFRSSTIMNFSMIFSSFLILLMNEILSTQSTEILENRIISNVIVDNATREAFASASQYKMKEVEYKTNSRSDRKINGFLRKFFGGFFDTKTTETSMTPGILQDIFGTKIIFRDVNFYFHATDGEHTSLFSLVPRKASDERINVTTRKLRITLEVELRRETNEPFSGFGLFTTLHFKNFVLIATRTNETKFDFDISYEKYFVWNHGAGVKIKWHPFELDFPGSEEDDLTREITPVLPLLLREHIKCNQNFSLALDKIMAKSCIVTIF